MTVDTLLMVLGASVAALPFLGFPSSWDNVLYVTAGILVLALGIIVRRRGARLLTPSVHEETYSESAHRHEELAQ